MAEAAPLHNAEQDAGVPVGTLPRAFAVLDVMAHAGVPMRFTPIMQATGMARATLHRLLRQMETEGLVRAEADGAWSMGTRLLRLAASTWARSDFRRIAEPHLNRLHEATGETVHLGVFADERMREVAYLDKVEARRGVRMHSQVGNASPLHCTGVGKALLSTLTSERLGAVVGALELTRFTTMTLHTPEALVDEIETARAHGIAHDREEHEPGIRCVAAPARLTAGEAGAGSVAAVSVTAPAFRVGAAYRTLGARGAPHGGGTGEGRRRPSRPPRGDLVHPSRV